MKSVLSMPHIIDMMNIFADIIVLCVIVDYMTEKSCFCDV